MTVARRELKTIQELREWIEGHAAGSGASGEVEVPPYMIVRQPPTTGAADWNVVDSLPPDSVRPRWSSARQHAIRTARLLFDVR